jgi:hypothetical protein
MHDAFLIYCMLANMRHTGHIRFAGHLFRCAKAKCAALRLFLGPMWKWLLRSTSASSGTARGSSAYRRNETLRRDWLQALTRLESYVASTS